MTARREVRSGVPELVIDGILPSPAFGRLMQPNYQAREKLDQFRRPGLDLFFTGLGELHAGGWCWDGRDGYDYAQYDLHVASILDKRADARLVLYIGGRPPYLWQRDHEADLIVLEDGTVTNMGSFTAPAWIADSSEAVRRFVEHFESSRWASSIAGYNPIYFSNEWLMGGFHTDYAPAAVDRFRKWLRTEYRDDEAALQRAWKLPDATFDEASPPRGVDYDAHGATGMFDRFERYGTYAQDYLRFFNDSVADLIIAHATAAKDGAVGEKLVSVMFGYTYSYPNNTRSPAHSSHQSMVRLLESPNIDLIHAPYDYYNRCHGGVHFSQICADSVQLHGKVFADQIDTKTHTYELDRGNATTAWESDQILVRDVSFSVMRSAYHYYYEMGVAAWRGTRGPVERRVLNFAPDSIQDTMVRLRAIAEENRDVRPAPIAQVALVSSRASAYYRAFDRRYSNLFLQGLRNYFLAYAPAPFDEYFLEDFQRIDRKYRVYIFPDASYMSSAERSLVRERLEAAGATAVWFYAPGFVSELGTSVESIHELTGIRVQADASHRGPLQVDVVSPTSLVANEQVGMTYGTRTPYEFFQSTQEWLSWKLTEPDDYLFSPMFYVDDPDAETHGRLQIVDRPGLVTKQVGGMTSVYSGAPLIPPVLWRSIYEGAGVHLYSTRDDLVYANSRFVTVCANGEGPRTITLPVTGSVTNALTGDCLVADGRSLEITLRHGEALLMRLDASS